MELSLKGKRAIITAGAAGIGRIIADTFMRAGARVHACDISAEAIAKARGTAPALGISQADVSDAAQVDRYFDQALGALGGLDILVNNAGIAGPTGEVEAITPADWDRTVAVNLNGMFYAARRAAPALKKSGGGSIVIMSSVAGRLGYPLRTPYAATKWAAIGLSHSLAMELGPSHIRVNALLPGIVEGERIRRVIDDRARASGVSFAEMEQNYMNRSSLRSMVSPQNVADMALFLCSDAGRNITGQAISIDGNVETLRA